MTQQTKQFVHNITRNEENQYVVVIKLYESYMFRPKDSHSRPCSMMDITQNGSINHKLLVQNMSIGNLSYKYRPEHSFKTKLKLCGSNDNILHSKVRRLGVKL